VKAVGVVVIGRNEGERLKRCLDSLQGRGWPVVYVDSGSTDGSLALARNMNCEALALDPARPFSAARARNEGVSWMSRQRPELEYLQLLDGDTELLDGWVDEGLRALESRPDACAVVGRLKERHPEQSVYNRICDLEWKLPLGEVHMFGGIAMMRVKAFVEAGGFDASLIAGEEPEFAQRLRRSGWKILSLDKDMALHDAGLTRFGQWWKRALRSGHAYAQVCWMGSGLRGRFGLRACARVWFWIVVFPILAGLSYRVHPLAPLAAAALYPLQMLRIAFGLGRRGAPAGTALAYGMLWLPSQGAQWLGQLKFLWMRLTRRESTLIEYKSGPVTGPVGKRENG
jgi:GT2 family glycosyltransferase